MTARFLLESGGGGRRVQGRRRPHFKHSPLLGRLQGSRGHDGMVRYRTEEAGADVKGANVIGWSPNLATAVYNHPQVARILVEERGACANKAGSYGRTPLRLSAANNRLEVVEWLVTETGAGLVQGGPTGALPSRLRPTTGHTAVASFLEHWTLSVLPRRAPSSPRPTSLAARNRSLLLLFPRGSARSTISAANPARRKKSPRATQPPRRPLPTTLRASFSSLSSWGQVKTSSAIIGGA